MISTLRQRLAGQAVAVLIEPVGIPRREVELGLFLGLEVLAIVVLCWRSRSRSLGLLCRLGPLRGLGGIRRRLGGFGRFLLWLGGLRLGLGRLVRPYHGYDIRDQVVGHH